MKVLVENAEKLEISLKSGRATEAADRLKEVSADVDSWTEQVAEDVKLLWMDEGIKQVITRKDKEFHLLDSAPYFFENVDRYKEKSFVPNNQDILRARRRTMGVLSAKFKWEELVFQMFDVGGQRSERRKWIHCFDGVRAVLFVSSIAEYDQVLREDPTKNRMLESLELFEQLVDSPWFKDSMMVLFLNKKDLFQEKITRVDLKVCFDNYNEGCNEEPAKRFIEEQFRGKTKRGKDKMFVHHTCALETTSVQVVFQTVKIKIVELLLQETNF